MSLSGGLSLGLGGGLNRLGVGGGAAFTLNTLSGLAVTLLPALSRQQGKLWQDASKTVPATADTDPVRVAVCPYTALEWTAPSDAARPLLRSLGAGKWHLACDGVDDYLQVTLPGWSGTVGSLSVRMSLGSTSGTKAGINVNSATSANEYYKATTLAYARNFRAVRYDAYATLPADTNQHTQTWVSGASAYTVRMDGSVVGSTTPNWQSPNAPRFGVTDSTVYSNLRCAGLVLAAAEWDAATVAAVEKYLGELS